MKRVTVLVLALAVGLAWFVWPGPGATPPATNDATEGEGPRGSGATPGPGLAAGRAPTLRATPGADGGPPERGTSAIVGVVRRGALPAVAKVELRWLLSNREYERGEPGGGAVLAKGLALWVPPAPMRAAASGDDGRFTFDGIPAGAYEVAATAADGARGASRVRVVREGARIDVEVLMFAGSETLDGRVLFEDGRPFAGVVLVTPHPSMRFDEVSLPEASGTRLVLDGEGRFHAVALPRGKVAVGALTVGSLRVNGMVVSVPYQGEYVLRVPLPGSVVGRVVADTDGSGIAGAEVLGTGMTGNALALVYGRTVTDAGGAFSLALPASGRLSARADGYAGVTRPYADSKLEIRLLRPARLEGRVTSSAPGTGVAGVEVRLRSPRDREVAFPPEPAITDADGRYAFEGLEPGETFVLAAGPGWMTRGAAEARMDGFNPFLVRLEPGKTATLDLVVETGAAIAGRVLDPDGRPVGGALVRARRLTMDFDSVLGRFESWGEPTAANADGVFRLDSLAPGATYRVSAGAPGFASAFVDATAPEGEAVPPIELHLGAAHALVVTVLDDEHGVPIPGASVICELSRGDLTTTDEWVTGSDGRASIYPVGAVGVHVNASADGFRRSGRLDVPASRAEAVVRLTPGLDIVGRVLSSDGTPAAGVRVRCTPPESEVTTGADGTFRVWGLGEGPHELRATASYPQPLTAVVTVDAGRTDVILTLAASAKDEPSRALIVRVLDGQGVAVPGAHVEFSWSSPSGDSSSSTGRETVDGAARFENLAERGEGTIRVSQARARDGTAMALGPTTVEHVSAAAAEIVVRLPAGLSISGRVLGPNGLGVAGVSVHALTEEAMTRWAGWRVDRVPAGAAAMARTTADGTFHLDGLADAMYALALDVPPDLVRPEPVRAGSGRRNVEITLKSGVVAAIRVVDADGAPVRGAHVGLYPVGPPGAAPLLSQWTLESGSVRFTSLDPSTAYRLAVQVPSKRANLVAPAPVEPWIPHDDVVRLSVAGAVRGVVLDTEGKPVPGARVWWTQGDASNGPGLVAAGDDGSFEIPHLPTGSIRLRADLAEGTPTGPPSTAPTWTEASTSGDKVVLTIDLGLALDVIVENWPEESPIRSQPAQARLFDESATPGTGVAFAQVSHGGRVRFRGLKAARKYMLWVGPVGDSFVRQGGLSAGRETRVRLVPGGSITVRLEGLSSRATWIGVLAEADGLSVEGKKQDDGRYRIRGLPEGRWTVRAFGGGDKAPRLSAQTEASTGAEVTLTLQAELPPR